MKEGICVCHCRKFSTSTAVLDKKHCPLCGSAHLLSSCEQFIKLSRYKKSDFLKRNGRCCKCFEKVHIVKHCKVEIKCTVEGCDKQDSHHTLMHKFELHDTETYRNAKDNAAICSCAAMHSSSHLSHWNRFYLMTVPVAVRSADRKIQTYALLDTGSKLTFCDRQIVYELELTAPEKEYRYSSSRQCQDRKRYAD